jgi:cell wall-associated NlpC family hydrolase
VSLRRTLALAVVPCLAPPLAAQHGVSFTAGYLVAGEPDQSTWRLTMHRALAGPIGLEFGAQVLPGSRPSSGDLYGFEVDFTLFDRSPRLPAVVIGAAGGVGSQQQDRVFYGVSAGLRLPLLSVGSARSALEIRWRDLSVDGRDGLELGAVLGWRSAPARATPDATGLYVPRRTTEHLLSRGIPEEKARLLGNIVSTALEEMGQPYVWGGTGDGSGGFDCSGLIYFSYARYGIRIPRTSAGQATAGIAIERDIDLLLPGDILTFADGGGDVTHVGLYVGEDRFIHSASGGVRLSRLVEEDPNGRYWLRRWVGVRRVVE